MSAETTSSGRAPRGSGDLLRERLLDAALAIVAEHGDASPVTIRAVTRRAGVSPTAFYLHFETREALLSALVQRGFEAFRAAVGAGVATGSDPRSCLLGGGLAYMRFAREQPALYAIIFGPHEATDNGDGPGKAAFDDLLGLVAANLPGVGDDEVRRRAQGIWTGMHGYVTLTHAGDHDDWPAEQEFAKRLAAAWLGA